MTFSPARIAIYALLLLFAALYLMPIYVLLITGMKSFREVGLDRMWDFPSGFHFDSFRDAFDALSKTWATASGWSFRPRSPPASSAP